MSEPVPAENPAPEVIGEYTVHPAASLFPLLGDDDPVFDGLKQSIADRGQIIPIVVQGKVLLDGRNRLRACLQMGIEPKVEEYSGPRTPTELIEDLNLSRRDLDPDERTMIVTKLFFMSQEERKRLAQQAAAQRGKEGGRGKKKTPDTNSYPGFSEPKRKEKNARSTVGQIAAKAKVSHHKAAQALALAQKAPDLANEVQQKKRTLTAATKRLKERGPSTATSPRKQQRSFLDTKTRLIGAIRRATKAFPAHRDELMAAILDALKD